MHITLTHCKLCGHDVPHDHLHPLREGERNEIVEYTIQMIKSRHPEWAETDPACQRCWDFYRQL